MKKAFTLIELVVAIALLGMVLSFSGVIFKVSIDSHRTSGANTDIMQKLRAITDQLNTDFKELPKDGYLFLHCELQNRRQYPDDPPAATIPVYADRMYYFCTGDFQSWYDRSVRSDIARVYLGHDYISLDSARDEPVSRWNLARDLLLLTPGTASPLPIDCNGVSYAGCKANPVGISANAGILLGPPLTGLPPRIDIRNDANDVRRLMCEDVGEILIEWSDGKTRYPATHPNPVLRNSLVWFGYEIPRKDGAPIDGIAGDLAYDGTVEVEGPGPPRFYRAFWTPLTPKRLWPKALKFTFTLYDSKGILEKGMTFTHIVYLDS